MQFFHVLLFLKLGGAKLTECQASFFLLFPSLPETTQSERIFILEKRITQWMFENNWGTITATSLKYYLSKDTSD